MYFVYILKNQNEQLYIGYSSNLDQRIVQHRNNLVKTTARLGFGNLIYYEAYLDEASAKLREKKLKQFGSSYQGLIKRINLK
ncbi:MAG: GIY-YIG nuclease family protein [Candidatus Doudnabacteria bacterium]|nr:GIY-YIG nuclease family protein [Candidatus Doudnabacteria bacterium]